MPNDITPPPAPLGENLRDLWLLDPEVTFLNHGSFGAVPRAIREAFVALQERIEAEPIEFIDRRLGEVLGPSRERVAAFLGIEPDSFGFVTNATEGVNAVLRSLRFREGDELLTTSHVYNAVRNAMRFRARETGARYVEVPVPLPIREPLAVVHAIEAAVSERTRLVVVDQVTSPTALVFPVEALSALCARRGIELLVDGAHVPGMLDVDVDRLGCTYWTGNLHKWCCAPKGAAVLWVTPERRSDIHPLAISHFLDQGFVKEFDWQGTRDLAAWGVAGAAIDWLGKFGWEKVRAHNRQLAAHAHDLWCESWRVEPVSPREPTMLGFMATVPLPEAIAARFASTLEFQRTLYRDHRIEVPIVPFDGRWHARASAQLYNRPDDYERLAEVVRHLAAG
ncbi:MAG: aminotransferase class V-fold PLP-dependent enzyme [Deltaproteobacteria bacterium]|nr:aminotransferase class V-fold PLP-dependent enzyme [Deltaproteobacteria bacterium]